MFCIYFCRNLFKERRNFRAVNLHILGTNMTDPVNAGNSYEQSQQEMESGEVEIVDSGQVSKIFVG